MRIALIGPESCGKSTLAVALAERLHVSCVDEYARDYVARLTRPYGFRDVCAIAHQQIRQIAAHDHAVFDTELILTEVWFRRKWGRCPQWLKSAQQAYPMDGYLVLAPSLPWVADPTRENPDCREELFRVYLTRVRQTGIAYTVISGTDAAERLNQAMAFCRGLS